MSGRDTPHHCPHGRGFHCLTCWPAQEERRTVTVHLPHDGPASLASPHMPIGPRFGVYAITGVPPTVTDEDVVRQLRGFGVLHPPDAPAEQWTLTWREIVRLSMHDAIALQKHP